MLDVLLINKINNFLFGAIMIGSLAVALFFLKFYRKTEDRFFAYFSAAFAMFSVERWFFLLIDGKDGVYNETLTYVYIIRLVAFLLIIAAILEKNRRQT